MGLALLAQLPVLTGWLLASAAGPLPNSTNTAVVPALADAAAVLAGGEWPWWNPYAHLGEPFAVSGVQPLYPGYWPVLFGGMAWLPWVLAAHSALACALAYRWLRALPGSRFVAFVGGSVFGVGCFYQAQLQQLPEAAALAWLPLALEATWRLTRPGLRGNAALLLAIGAAAVIATGAVATPRFGLGACVLLGILNLRGLPRWDWLPALLRLSIGSVGAALLSAPVWLHHFEMAAALRTEPSEAPAPTSALALLFAPAHLDAQHMPGTWLASGASALVLFPGSLVLGCLVLGFLRPSLGRPRWPWLLLAAIGTVCAIDGPWAPWLHTQIGLTADHTGSGVLLLQLAALALACLALDGFFELPAPQARTQFAGVLCLTLATVGALLAVEPSVLPTALRPAGLSDAVLGRCVLPPTLGLALLGVALLAWRKLGILRFKTALGAVAALECVGLAWWSAPQRTRPEPVTIHGAELGRVVATDGKSLANLARSGTPVQRVNSQAQPRVQRTASFLAALGSDLPSGLANHTMRTPLVPALLSLARIEVVLGDGVVAATPGAEPIDSKPLDWARMVFDSVVVADADAARAALVNLVNPSKTVVLEGLADAFPARQPHRPAQVEVVARSAHRAHIRVDAGQGRGHLVIADNLAPGWHATIDGEPTPLIPANLAFAAVAVSEGKHDIELVYDPLARQLGLPLGGLGAALCAVLVALEQVRRRRPRAHG